MPRLLKGVIAIPCGLAACSALLALATATQTRSQTPAPASPPTPTTGREIFATSGCTHCHGDAGLGTDKGPSLHDLRKRLNDDQVRHQIHDGGQSMPPFADALTAEQITRLVTFLRSKAPWPKQ